MMPRQDFAAVAPFSKLPHDHRNNAEGGLVVPVKYRLSAGFGLESVEHKYCLSVYIA
jgi:hypothetical protein